MMVAFIGMPAITWLGIALMMIVSTAVLQVWFDRFAAQLNAPLSLTP